MPRLGFLCSRAVNQVAKVPQNERDSMSYLCKRLRKIQFRRGFECQQNSDANILN